MNGATHWLFLTQNKEENMKSSDESQVYQIKITLSGSEPAIWRRFLIEPSANLFKLHQAIQNNMGWTNSHMHQYRKGKIFYGKLDEEDENKFKIFQVFDKLKAKLVYEYDMGDGWEHILVLEKILPREDKIKYPICLEGAMACPPEDCGGIYGFYNLLEIIKNPDHEEHEDMMEWMGDDFDPEEFNLDAINQDLKRMK
jgi:hypothetical protein